MPTTHLPTAEGCTLQDAGQNWDAVRVPRELGLAAAAILGTRCGAVLDYPHKDAIYYFVSRGAASHWEVEGTEAISEGYTLTIPPARCTQAPGPHWRVCPGDSDWLTDARALQAALEDCAPNGGSDWSL
ncbi:hypothetical protein ACFYOF_17145 [Streptomyces sp. NPDC007148]|uniref:hypothetical protein n=1 Tax=Streptomyces sp. NPDC007148 TaxID=3364775 RepID=UPI00369435E1